MPGSNDVVAPISASDLASFVGCAHRAYLDEYGDQSRRLPPSASLEALWRDGREHEDRIIESFGPTEITLDADPVTREQETLRVLRSGASRIFGSRLTDGRLVGMPDILERIEQSSSLGAFAYVPVDVKNASAYRGDRPKPEYLAQLCTYAELLETVQGWRPTFGRIIDCDGKEQTLDLLPFWERYQRLKTDLRAVLDETTETQPTRKPICKLCVWQVHCGTVRRRSGDLSDIPGLGESRASLLRRAGVGSIAELANLPDGRAYEIPGTRGPTVLKWRRQARVTLRRRHEVVGAWVPRTVDFEISYDIENDGDDVFLHGLLVREQPFVSFRSRGFRPRHFGRFEPLLRKPQETPRVFWRRFLAKVEEFDGRGEYVVYIYGSHERTYLRRLARRHGGAKNIASFLERTVDLLHETRATVLCPIPTLDLKAIAKYAGFRRRTCDVDGFDCVWWWRDYAANPRHDLLRRRILRYNEDDVRASVAVRDWLANLRPRT